MKKYLFFFLVYLNPLLATCQYYDANWISGAGYDGIPLTPSNWIDFTKYPYTLTQIDGNMGLYLSTTTLSDKKGNLLLYSNGIQVLNNDHKQLENGDSLNWGEVAQQWYAEGYSLQDGMIGLPEGNNDSVFYLIHSKIEYAPIFGVKVPKTLYSIADMRLNNGKGKITKKIKYFGMEYRC